MHTETTIAGIRGRLRDVRQPGTRIGLVPTMGNLHEGHLSLVDRARELADRVVVSIFVNPLQFGPDEDLERYPRTLAADRDKLASAGVDLLFAPDLAEIYPKPLSRTTRVAVPELSDVLCGASRPGHFQGVATVVNMLFNILEPDIAVFGQKDYQQLLVIRRMVEDLHLPVQVVSGATLREPDGLAMSSRNAYLSDSERVRARELYRTLRWSRDRIRDGVTDYVSLERQAADRLAQARCRLDYVAIRQAADLSVPDERAGPLVLLAAAWFGAARLIDNILLDGAD